MLQGGGWCVDEASCAERSRTSLGSTAQLAAKQRSLRVGGILHGLALRNPDFYAFHRVLLHYCDGGSFTGDRDVGALRLRGRAVLDAQLRRLEVMGLADAERPLWRFRRRPRRAGPRRRGATRLRRVRQFGVLAASGFFWPGAGADAVSRWVADPLAAALRLPAAAARCICLISSPPKGYGAASPRARRSRCARRYSSRTRHSTWQLVNVWGEGRACAASCFSRCDADEVRRLNRILGTFVDGVRRAVLARAGTAPSSPRARSTRGAQKLGLKWAIGGVPLRLALRRWWETPPDAPAEAHAHLSCALRGAGNGSQLRAVVREGVQGRAAAFGFGAVVG